MKKALGKIAVLLLAAVLFAGVQAAPAFAASDGNAGLTAAGVLSTQSAKNPSISVKSLLLKKGQSHVLKLEGAKKVTWRSSNKKVATVTNTGRVKAKSAGTATVTAKYRGKSYKCAVTVSSGKKKTLVVYFSATGTTKAAATKLKKVTKADIVRLQPKVAYTSSDLNYRDDSSRATREQRDETVRPKVSTKIKNLKQYDTIYLGYPIWWGKAPKVVYTFLESNSMKGKTVMPFCTSGSSGISGSMDAIRKLAKGATVKPGIDLTYATSGEMKSWVATAKTK